jgi:hypothetical protein
VLSTEEISIRKEHLSGFKVMKFAEALDKYQKTACRPASRAAARSVEDQSLNKRVQ